MVYDPKTGYDPSRNPSAYTPPKQGGPAIPPDYPPPAYTGQEPGTNPFPAPASPAPVKPAPSPVTMNPDEYSSAVETERSAALDLEEKAMTERHTAQRDGLDQRQAAEAAALAARRDSLKKETEAVKRHCELSQRHTAELAYASHDERDAMRVRHDAERAALVRETGFEVMQPMTGDTIYPGFVKPLPGHPWVRPWVRAV